MRNFEQERYINKKWMYSKSRKHNHKTFIELLLIILAILILCSVLIFGSQVLMKYGLYNLNTALFFVFVMGALCFALAVYCANRIMVPQVLVFFLTEDRHLFYIDARKGIEFVNRGIIGALQTYWRADKRLNQFREAREVPTLANDILWVKNIRTRRKETIAVCHVQRWDGKLINQTVFIDNNLPDAASLMQELEFRQKSAGLETASDKNIPRMIIGIVLMLLFSILCYLSHREIKILSESIYFPCLALDLISLNIALYHFIKYRRGEK